MKGVNIYGDLGKIGGAEAAVFDCDGTLIDASGSYDLAIKLTTAIVLDRVCGLKIQLGPELDRALDILRLLGGFNNDWDSTSAIIQAICVFAPESPPHPIRSENLRVEDYVERVNAGESAPEYVAKALRWLEREFSACEGFMDLKAVEEVIEALARGLSSHKRLIRLREVLGYPGEFGGSFLATLFDEIFLGARGVEEKYGMRPRYVVYRGTLENERLMIEEETLKRLRDLMPRGLALMTGRGRWETEKTMAQLLRYFNLSASIYSADLGPDYEKPSAKPLVESAHRLGAEKIIYVGNSMEDLLTAQAASREGVETAFIAVAQNRLSGRQLAEKGADAIIDDINLLPDLIVFSRRSPGTLI